MTPNQRRTPAALFALCLTATPALAGQPPRSCAQSAKPGDLLAIDFESLLNVTVITASKSAETLADAAGAISVVTRDELERFGGITLGEILQRVPGLTGTSSYFTDRSLIAARGDQTKANGGHILILINGRPTREILEGGLISDLLEAFPVNVLERIEVIKGPGSVLYGSNAFSAVVNLIVQKAERSGLVLTGLAGRSGAYDASGQATLNCGDLNLIASVNYHSRPDWETAYYSPPALGDPLASGVPPIQNAVIENHAPSAYVGVNFKGLSFISSLTQWGSANFVRGEVGTSAWRRVFADVGYTTKAAANWDTSVNLTYTRNTFDGTGSAARIERASHEFVLEWTNFVNVTAKDRLTFGALYNYVQGRELYLGVTPAVTISDGSRPGEAAYAQLDHRLAATLKVIGGVQANKIGALDVDVVPRAGAIWTPVSRVNVKALYGQAFRAASINETTLNHPQLAGNPNLVPEKVATFDLGVTWQHNNVEAGVNYFRSKQTDTISIDFSQARWKYQNLGDITFQGAEVAGKYYLTKEFFLQGSLLYQTSEDTDGDAILETTTVPNFGFKAGFSYASNGLTASVFDSYDGELPYGATLNPGPAAHHLVNSHFRLDVFRFWHAEAARAVALFIHGDNLANQQVWMPDLGSNTGDTIPVNRGRTIYFGVEVSLGKPAAVSTR
jgi:outer membrane receptor for ferrienterochelin and colicins